MCLSEERGKAFEEDSNSLARTAFAIDDTPSPGFHFRPEGTRYKSLSGYLIIDGVKRKNAHSIREFLNESNNISNRFALHTSKPQVGKLPQIVSYPHSKRSFDCGSMQCHLKVLVHLADLRKAQRTMTKGSNAGMVGVKNQSDFRVSQGLDGERCGNIRGIACNADIGSAFTYFGENLFRIAILAERSNCEHGFGKGLFESRPELIAIFEEHDIDGGYLELGFMLRPVQLPNHIVHAIKDLFSEVMNDLSGLTEFNRNFLVAIDKRTMVEVLREDYVEVVQDLAYSGPRKRDLESSIRACSFNHGLMEDFELA